MSIQTTTKLKQHQPPLKKSWLEQAVFLHAIVDGDVEHPDTTEARRIKALVRSTPVTVRFSGSCTTVLVNDNAKCLDRRAKFAFPLTSAARHTSGGQSVPCGGLLKCKSPGHHHPAGFVAADDLSRQHHFSGDHPWHQEIVAQQAADDKVAEAERLCQVAVDLDAGDKARVDPNRAKINAAELRADREVAAAARCARGGQPRSGLGCDGCPVFADVPSQRKRQRRQQQQQSTPPAGPRASAADAPVKGKGKGKAKRM